LAPRAGFEPATIRLTVECSTAELPRNRRNLGVRERQRITKRPRLAKHEIGLPGVPASVGDCGSMQDVSAEFEKGAALSIVPMDIRWDRCGAVAVLRFGKPCIKR
jgi:hypothetical protein